MIIYPEIRKIAGALRKIERLSATLAGKQTQTDLTFWFGDTIVECKNCSHCEAIYKYLKRESKNAEN